jgi:aldose 1-epimerase
MSSFGVEEGRLGSLETLHLTDSGSGSSAVVARRGATLLSWDSAIVGGGNIDGYVDEDELVSQDGVRSGVMAPFSNRIRNGTYRFDGE